MSRADEQPGTIEPDRTAEGYLSVLLHQLNQPLTAIAGYLEGSANRLRERDPDEPVARALDRALAESRRATWLARELSDRIAARPRPARPFDLNVALSDLAPRLQEDLGARVRLEGGALRSGWIRGDADQVQEALRLLLRSVADAFPSDERLVVLQPVPGSRPSASDASVDLLVRVEGHRPNPSAASDFSERLARPHEFDDHALRLASTVVEAHQGSLAVDADVPGVLSLRISFPTEPEITRS